MKKIALALCAFIVMGYVHAERPSTPDGLPEILIQLMTHDAEVEEHLDRSGFIQGFNPSDDARETLLHVLSAAKRTAEGAGLSVLAYAFWIANAMPDNGFQIDDACAGNMTLP